MWGSPSSAAADCTVMAEEAANAVEKLGVYNLQVYDYSEQMHQKFLHDIWATATCSVHLD